MAEGGSEEDLFENSLEEQATELEKLFSKAADHLQTKVSELDSEQLLYYYARYKQATNGPCNIPKPRLFDFQGKQKWCAWRNLGDMPKETAMIEYINALHALDPEWRPKIETPPKSKKLLGAVVSVMSCEDEYISEEQKTVFDWVKENNLKKLSEVIKSKGFLINQYDEQGMTLLHWACDRGYSSVAEILLQEGIDINAQDGEGLTALHYASSCGHSEIVRLLLKHAGVESTKQDNDGMMAKDLALNEEISNLFIS